MPETATAPATPAAGDDELLVLHHFDDADQQSFASNLGMWAFLATEVMFFGGLFLGYTVYRWKFPDAFAEASRRLNVPLGAVNTAVLLGSSLTMALAVRASQLRRRVETTRWLAATMALGTVFLGIKAVEWTADWHEHLVPGLNWHPEDFSDPGRSQLFFLLYFWMTGLHAIHLIIGIGLVGVMAALDYRRWLSGAGETHIEVTGLYWHFIDIVWVFLYPLLYLISPHR